MSQPLSWSLVLQVREGRLDDAGSLMAEMVASTRKEDGALEYQWFLSGDGGTCHLVERYADDAAVLAHLGNFGTHFVERFLGCFDVTSFHVYGAPSDAAKAILDGFGAVYLASWGGFVR